MLQELYQFYSCYLFNICLKIRFVSGIKRITLKVEMIGWTAVPVMGNLKIALGIISNFIIWMQNIFLSLKKLKNVPNVILAPRGKKPLKILIF